MGIGQRLVAAGAAAVLLLPSFAAATPTRAREEVFDLRGHPLVLHLYGADSGTPVVVASGDGGWLHLAPHVADELVRHGFFVVGVDSRAYLESFTAGATALRPDDVPRDFAAIAMRASHASGRRAVLIGVSEGAGLSVLAASAPALQPHLAGVITFGLPERAELAWHWKDAMIYLTHGVPNEPLFSARAVLPRVAPVPFAAIYSDHDEFVSPDQIQTMLHAAADPKRLWIVPASNHRFSDNQVGCDAALAEALEWMASLRR